MLKECHRITTRSQSLRFRLTRVPPLPRRQRGAFAVMTAALILVILGFCGFAIDLSRVYNRKVELQTLADAVALAAAVELDGTEAGIGRAMNAAATAAGRNQYYEYSAASVEWLDDALRFSWAPSGAEWLDEGEARTQAREMFYVEVDTQRLADHHGNVSFALLQVFPSAGASAHISGRAVAGRSTINVMPLAICVISELPGDQKNDELIEYGFRRGISYNLMGLNPKERSSPANFLINPVAPPGTVGSSMKTRLDVIRPFICTGTMAIPRVTGDDITVERDFPLESVFAQLNSRFASYTAPCNATNAPPDSNVKEYTVSPTTNAISWMKDKPAGQAAATARTASSLLTVADVPSDPESPTTAPMYGPLWIYAKAAKYSDYRSGQAEPAGGYSTFSASNIDWEKLYSPNPPQTLGTYPSPVPAKASNHTLAPPTTMKSIADRRILNIPLLRCPVSGGSPGRAEVLAVGKFYMTIQATQTALVGEFAGLARQEALVGQVELYE